MTPSFSDLLKKEEPLHPDLVSHLKNDGLPTLHHPLVIQVPYFPQMNAFINFQFAKKKEKLSQAIEDCDLERILALTERPFRAEALLQFGALATDQEYWKGVAWAYTDSENIDQVWPLWKTILSAPRPGRIQMMTEKERAHLEALPDTFVIYRGGVSGAPIRDASWTLNIDVARWFANRFNQNGQVLKGEVCKSDVISYQARRGESEIMVYPEHVKEMGVFEDRPARPRMRK